MGVSIRCFKIEGDTGEIFDLTITNTAIQIALEWEDHSLKDYRSDLITIVIEAEHIWWENLPDMAIPFE